MVVVGGVGVVLMTTVGVMMSSSVPEPYGEQSSSSSLWQPGPAPENMMSSVTPSFGVVC